jgi:transcriptional regulator with XRE-family HTH domain
MKNYEEYMNEIDKFLSAKSDKDYIEIKTIAIQLDILNEIQKLMDEKKMKREDLAKAMGISKSFVSRIFSGDKMINLKMIAQFQDIFKCNFTGSFEPVSGYVKNSQKIPYVAEKNDFNQIKEE